MKVLTLIIFALISQFIAANESSTQFYVQPLKVKQQVGKEIMTEVGFYRFPVYMQHTHPAVMLNHICSANTLEEFTPVKDKSSLTNVNLASLYKVSVSYDLTDDVTLVDLTKVSKPANEPYSEEEVIAMTLECVRRGRSHGKITILTNAKTKKWKPFEKTIQTLKKPIYTVKTVPLKLKKDELLYHSSFWIYELAEDYSEYPRHVEFITYGGSPEDHLGSDTSYNGIGLSYMLSIDKQNGKKYNSEMNPLAGYTFLKTANTLTVKAPHTKSALSKEAERKLAAQLISCVVDCIHLTAKSKGDSYKDFQLKVIDTRLSKDQCEAIQTKWSKGEFTKTE